LTPLAKVNNYLDEQRQQGADEWTVETARAMLYGYFLRYEKHDADLVVRGIEVPFSIELPVPDDLPEEWRPQSPRYVGGIIDSIVERDGKLYATDLKTASWASDAYWQELYTNNQLTQYKFAMFAAGFEGAKLEWDVVVKPGIEPKKLTLAAKEEVSRGNYCGWPVPTSIPEDGRETPVLYGRRLASWYEDRPDSFQRRAYDRSPEQLVDFIYQQHRLATLAEQLSLKGGDPIYLHGHRNQHACNRFGGGLCDYHGLCSGHTDPAKAGLRLKEASETVRLDLGMTTSQSKILSSCQAEWYYKYQSKLEPMVKKKAKALDLGSLVHAGREVLLADRLENPIVLPLEKPQKTGA